MRSSVRITQSPTFYTSIIDPCQFGAQSFCNFLRHLGNTRQLVRTGWLGATFSPTYPPPLLPPPSPGCVIIRARRRAFPSFTHLPAKRPFPLPSRFWPGQYTNRSLWFLSLSIFRALPLARRYYCNKNLRKSCLEHCPIAPQPFTRHICSRTVVLARPSAKSFLCLPIFMSRPRFRQMPTDPPTYSNHPSRWCGQVRS